MLPFAETSGWLPPALGSWPPVFQAITLGLATLVQEDVPTVTAAILAALGMLSTSAGFWGCFLGIWFGDLLLFLMARGLGPPVLQLAWVKRRLDTHQLARTEAWFSRRGVWLLISARMIPGTRLPTYLAAGLLRWPAGSFFAVTGFAAAIWTAAWFALARLLGAQLTDSWNRWHRHAWLIPAIMVVVWLGFQLPGWWRRSEKTTWRVTLLRWTQWEFWPAWLFYIPLILRYIALSIRHRGLTVPSSANPGIAYGGLVGESKIATLRDLWASSPEFTAEAWYLAPGSFEARRRELAEIQTRHSVSFPFILKPDFGQRGMGVKLVRSEADVVSCLQSNVAPLVVQRYVAGPFEAGLFYYRMPNEPKGRLFAVTEKIFPEIVGDGVRTLEQLIREDQRARFVAGKYLVRFANRRNEVLGVGETLRLVEAGNHAQGCIFRDGERLATPALVERIDQISQSIPGFFVGRYDVRYESESALSDGRGFKILELNGASAEATNVYDARNSLWQAYRTLFRQWSLVFAIGAANRSRGHAPCGNLELFRAWRDARALFAQYPIAD